MGSRIAAGAPAGGVIERGWRAGALNALALVLLLSTGSCGGPAGQDPAGPSSPLPGVELPTVHGEPLALTGFPGKLVVVDFWATWCTPCRLQTEILEELHGELGGGRAQFLAVNVGEPRDLVESFLEERPVPYPVLLDTEERLTSPLAIYALPTVLILDGEGRVVYRQPGISSKEVLQRALREAELGSA